MIDKEINLALRAATYAWDDVRIRYSRSLLGPLWITLGMAIFIAAKGLLFGEILEVDLKEYLPFLGSGIVIWTWINSQISAASNVYPKNKNTIQNINIPIRFYLYSHLSDTSITYLHNFIVIVFLSMLYGYFGVSYLYLIPGTVVLCITGYFVSSVVAIIGARFRDIGHLLQSVMRVAFFLTPIMWMPDMVPGHMQWIISVNPFYHFIELVRAPLMGNEISGITWLVTILFLLMFYIANTILMRLYSSRIVFWL